MLKKIFILFILIKNNILCEELIFNINGNRALHTVNEKFLSVSVDPAILLTGLNLSKISLELIGHFGPTYIRIAGPSTKFVKYDNDDEQFTNPSQSLSEKTNNIFISPSIWFGINEWLIMANLTPVFAINDYDNTKGIWNPKEALSLLELSDQFNLTCFWQLGFDCSNKSELRYKEDLLILRHVLEAFPDRRESWKIVGSDLSRCINNESLGRSRQIIDELHDLVGAVMWEPENFLRNTKLLGSIKSKIPIWTAAPKSSHPISFQSAILWANQIGEAAKLGYDVIFRQLRIHEIFSETPVYWTSLFFKHLMGRTVLEVKTNNIFTNSHVSVYAHCTKKQNSFVRRGAVTLLIINNSTHNQTALLRFGSIPQRTTEVQSYIFTAPSDDSIETYLNDEKLTSKIFQDNHLNFVPKLRRAKILNFLNIQISPKSIGFFVLPVARIPICISDEEQVQQIIEEIHEDQNIPFSKEISIELNSRGHFQNHDRSKDPHSLKEIQNLLKKELEFDEKFFNNKLKKQTLENSYNNKNKIEDTTSEPFKKEARNLIEFLKLSDRYNKQNHDHKKELRHLFEKKILSESNEKYQKQYNLKLTSSEIRKVLTDRAKAKAAKKNIVFTSDELEEIMQKATNKFLKNNKTNISMGKAKRSLNSRDKKDINMKLLNLKTLGEKRRQLSKQLLQDSKLKLQSFFPKKYRHKRDINMDLLKLKSDTFPQTIKNKKIIKTKFENSNLKEATLRLPDQTSEELMDNFKENDNNKKKSILPKGEIFAQMASSESFLSTERSKFNVLNNYKTRKPLLINNLNHLIVKPNIPVLSKHDLKSFKPTELNFDYLPEQKTHHYSVPTIFHESEDLNLEENDTTACIHEYFGSFPIKKSKVVELQEMSENTSDKEEINENKLPQIKNRCFKVDKYDDENDDVDVEDKADFDILKNLDEYLKKQQTKNFEEGLDEYDSLDSDEGKPIRFKRNDKIRIINDNNDKNIGKFYISIEKPYNSSKIKSDENWKSNQMKLLKTRLDHKKTLDQINKYSKMKHRRPRSIFQLDNLLMKQYEAFTDGIRKWKPCDILALSQSKNILKQRTTRQNINDSPIFKIFVGKNSINQSKRRKRSIIGHDDEDDKFNLKENEITNFPIEEIMSRNEFNDNKNKQVYEIIFPSKQKIKLIENGVGHVDLKFFAAASNDKQNNVTNINKIWKDHLENVTNLNTCINLTRTSNNEDNYFKKIYKSISGFLQDIKNKILNCMTSIYF